MVDSPRDARDPELLLPLRSENERLRVRIERLEERLLEHVKRDERLHDEKPCMCVPGAGLTDKGCLLKASIDEDRAVLAAHDSSEEAGHAFGDCPRCGKRLEMINTLASLRRCHHCGYEWDPSVFKSFSLYGAEIRDIVLRSLKGNFSDFDLRFEQPRGDWKGPVREDRDLVFRLTWKAEEGD